MLSSYSDYIDSIKSKLPSGVVELIDSHTLHDSKALKLSSSNSSKNIRLLLKGWDREFENQILYELLFEEVVGLDIEFPDDDNEDASGFGDLGYYEFDLVDNKCLIRMLFSSFIEVNVVFENLKIISRP